MTSRDAGKVRWFPGRPCGNPGCRNTTIRMVLWFLNARIALLSPSAACRAWLYPQPQEWMCLTSRRCLAN